MPDADGGALPRERARRQFLAVFVYSRGGGRQPARCPVSHPSSRLMQRSSVLFPAPLGPSRATTSPDRTVRSRVR